MARHRSPQSRRPSLPLLSPQFAATGAGAAGGYRVGGPHVRHTRGTSGVGLQSRSTRVAAALVAVGGVAGAAHASVQGTFLPDTQEMAGWFAASDAAPSAAVPAPRTPADATVADGSTLAALATPASARTTAATALTGAAAPDAGRPGSAVAGARRSIQDVRAAAAAPKPAAPQAASTAASGGGVQIVTGRVTSGFGSRWGTSHMGLDIAAPIGTPIHVPLAGTVINSGPASGFGLWVRVQHADGTITVYGHINRSLVEVGQKVSAGQQIAEVGNRGQTTGPHLHIEVIEGGTKINPKPWLDQHGFRYT